MNQTKNRKRLEGLVSACGVLAVLALVYILYLRKVGEIEGDLFLASLTACAVAILAAVRVRLSRSEKRS